MGAVAARRRLGVHLHHCVALPALLAGSIAHAQVAEPVRDPAVAGTAGQSTGQAETSLNAGQPVDSEDAADRDQSDIVVTGTLVRGIAPPGTNVIGVTQGDIQATGATTTAQLLQTIPQLGSFNDLQQPIAGGISVTVNRPNLRTLPGFDTSGGSTTLVLLDGHRIVGAGIVTTSPDPDIIPPGALQRLEIVPDGGSAIYGSDAVAGVLNFITLRKFSGLKVEGHYGLADNYHQADASATAGTDWGSGSAYVSYNYAEHGAIYGRDRDFIRQFPNQAPNVPTSGLLSIVCNPGNVQLNANSGTFYPMPFTTGTARAGAPNQCDTNDDQSYYPSERRHSVFGGISQELADGITLDTRGFYTNRETTRNGGAYMATSTLGGATIDRFFPTQRIGTETQQVDILPLRRAGQRIALIGPFVQARRDLIGPWTVHGFDSESVPLLEGMRAAMAEAVAQVGKPLVVLLRNGRALALEGAVLAAPAILVTWFLGSQTGHAIADILFGLEGPSGRLPVSFPHATGQQPYYYAHRSGGRPNPPGAMQPYKAHFREVANDAPFPFGHGLTYGRIAYAGFDAGGGVLTAERPLEVSATLTNHGSRVAEEVARLYVRDVAASFPRPVRELKQFRRIRLAPGRSATCRFTIQREDLAGGRIWPFPARICG